jgi:hypothetical protein
LIRKSGGRKPSPVQNERLIFAEAATSPGGLNPERERIEGNPQQLHGSGEKRARKPLFKRLREEEGEARKRKAETEKPSPENCCLRRKSISQQRWQELSLHVALMSQQQGKNVPQSPLPNDTHHIAVESAPPMSTFGHD